MRTTPIFVDLCYTSFVEFEDSRDADDAINDLDGKSIFPSAFAGRMWPLEISDPRLSGAFSDPETA